MLKGTTKSGFEYEVDKDAFDDMELIDALADVNSGRNILQLSTALQKIFDPDQLKRLYAHVKNDKGRVPTEPVMDIITEIISADADEKNS